MSKFIEYRCKEEEEEARAAKEKLVKKSTHVQTEPTDTLRNIRKKLPRQV